MHVIKIRDQEAVEHLYSAKLVRRANEARIFEFRDEVLDAPPDHLIELIPIQEPKATLFQ